MIKMAIRMVLKEDKLEEMRASLDGDGFIGEAKDWPEDLMKLTAREYDSLGNVKEDLSGFTIGSPWKAKIEVETNFGDYSGITELPQEVSLCDIMARHKLYEEQEFWGNPKGTFKRLPIKFSRIYEVLGDLTLGYIEAVDSE